MIKKLARRHLAISDLTAEAKEVETLALVSREHRQSAQEDGHSYGSADSHDRLARTVSTAVRPGAVRLEEEERVVPLGVAVSAILVRDAEVSRRKFVDGYDPNVGGVEPRPESKETAIAAEGISTEVDLLEDLQLQQNLHVHLFQAVIRQNHLKQQQIIALA